VVDEAHKHTLKVVAHAHRPEEIRKELLAGVDCFEHTGLAAAPVYPADIIAMLRERTAKMNLSPLFWTPTMEGLYNYESVINNPEYLDDDSWKLDLPPHVVEDIKKSIARPERLSYYGLNTLRKPTLERKVKQLKRIGGCLTDWHRRRHSNEVS
jgi:hypothetical protein